LADVADDVTLCETQPAELSTNPIEIDPGREKIRPPVSHVTRD
jgi:hypothetical protein